jgi:hypothetical protein
VNPTSDRAVIRNWRYYLPHGVLISRLSAFGFGRRIALDPKYLGLSFFILTVRLGRLYIDFFNLSEQHIVFVGNQASSFVHVFLWSRSVLRLGLGPTPPCPTIKEIVSMLGIVAALRRALRPASGPNPDQRHRVRAHRARAPGGVTRQAGPIPDQDRAGEVPGLGRFLDRWRSKTDAELVAASLRRDRVSGRAGPERDVVGPLVDFAVCSFRALL